MKAIEIQCSSYEWWGPQWVGPMPYQFDAQTVQDTSYLPGEPVTVYVMTRDHLEAAQLLRLLAAKLEREPQLLAPLSEPGNSPNNPAPVDDDGGCPF
ncbi:hypothetical protein [Acidovorax sp.]|uniref:hypothetical protein n=1 Tax=Acidovorax sp. TaxID=1872122 RepID=UPI002589133C|nr:hypothetical protein [Acidovorax sp.]